MRYRFTINEANQIQTKIRNDYSLFKNIDFGYLKDGDSTYRYIESEYLDKLETIGCDFENVFQYVFSLSYPDTLSTRISYKHEIYNFVELEMINDPITHFDFKKLSIVLYSEGLESFGDFTEIIHYTSSNKDNPVVKETFEYDHDLIGPVSRHHKLQYYFEDGSLDTIIYDRGLKIYTDKTKKTAGVRKRRNIIEYIEKSIIETIVNYRITNEGADPNDLQALIDEAGALAIGFVIQYQMEIKLFIDYNNKAIKAPLLLDDVTYPWLSYLHTPSSQALRTYLIDQIYQGVAQS